MSANLSDPSPIFERAAATTPPLPAAERETLEGLLAEPYPEPGLPPSAAFIIRTTRACNLRCSYCYVWPDGPGQTMTFSLMARVIRDALRDTHLRDVTFYWFGGEPTLLPIAFYEKALWLQRALRRKGHIIHNDIITNGTRVTDDWIRLWRNHNFRIRVSLDGPPEAHDAHRRFANGRPSSELVIRGIRELVAAGLRPSIDLVVSPAVLRIGPAALLEYALQLGVQELRVRYMLASPESGGSSQTEDTIPFSDYVNYLRELFRIWWPASAPRLIIQELTDLVSTLRFGPTGLCVHSGQCFGNVYTIEPDGDVFTCDDFFGLASHRFGNLFQTTLSDCARGSQLLQLRRGQQAARAAYEECCWFSVCHGGCPRWRLASAGLSGPNDRCCGMKNLISDIAAALAVAGPAQRPTGGV
jgi:serine-type anaerobic sulfatase-maturating enzyme